MLNRTGDKAARATTDKRANHNGNDVVPEGDGWRPVYNRLGDVAGWYSDAHGYRDKLIEPSRDEARVKAVATDKAVLSTLSILNEVEAEYDTVVDVWQAAQERVAAERLKLDARTEKAWQHATSALSMDAVVSVDHSALNAARENAQVAELDRTHTQRRLEAAKAAHNQARRNAAWRYDIAEHHRTTPNR